MTEARPAPLEQFLSDTLKAARNGSLRAFCAVGVGMDGTTVGGYCSGEGKDTMLMPGEVTCLQHRLIDSIREVNDGRV